MESLQEVEEEQQQPTMALPPIAEKGQQQQQQHQHQPHHHHGRISTLDGGLCHYRETTTSGRSEASIMTASCSTRYNNNNNNNNNLVLERYFVDHHSLAVPSSTVRFRGTNNATARTRNSIITVNNDNRNCKQLASAGSYVIENEYQQIILEEKIDIKTHQRTIQVKSVQSGNKGLQVLRGVYVIVFFLWVGIFVVFCVQVMLTMVLELPILAYADKGLSFMTGTFIAIITFCIAFAEGMVIATNMVSDSWNGRRLFKSLLLGRDSLIFLDWFVFIIIIAIPMITIAVMMFAVDYPQYTWWVVGFLVWFACATIYFLVFTICILFYELYGATSFVCSHSFALNCDSDNFKARTLKERLTLFIWVVHKCIMMKQKRTYSGRQYVSYLAQHIVEQNGDDDNNNGNDTYEEAVDYLHDKEGMIESSYKEFMYPLSRLTRWSFLGPKYLKCYKVLEKPVKLYNINDAQGLHPFMTKWTWSLERIFCNWGSSRYIAIIDGPGAMTKNQILSSFICFIVGIIIIMLLFIAFLTWFSLNQSFIIVISIILILILIIMIWKVRRKVALISNLVKQRKEFRTDDANDNTTGKKIFGWVCNQFNTITDNDALNTHNLDLENATVPATAAEDFNAGTIDDINTSNSASLRSTTPTPSYPNGAAAAANTTGLTSNNSDRSMSSKQQHEQQRRRSPRAGRRDSTFIEGPNTGLYVITKVLRVSEPSQTLCYVIMFLEIVIGYLFPLITLYCSRQYRIAIVYTISVGISRVRNYINFIAVIEETGTMNLAPGKSRTDRWLNQSRLHGVVEKISTDKAKHLWLTALGLGALALCGIWTISQTEPLQGTRVDTKFTMLPQFYYPANNDSIQYPTCAIGKTFENDLPTWSLADYAFLSIMAYRDIPVVKESLPIWFDRSGDNVTIDTDKVDSFLDVYGYKTIPGEFYLFNVITEKGTTTGIISVTGTSSKTEMLIDCQLWLTAFLIQILRYGLPFGDLFTLPLPYLMKVISMVPSGDPSKKNLYQILTEFIELQKKNPEYDVLTLTGHSLGGGIAFLSAAQTHTKAIALSGVNAMLSRMTFKPPITPAELNEYTFNIIPHYDIVPRIDDVAQNFQNINCLSKSPNPLNCHTNTRSLCELLFRCGSGPRPVLCECTKFYGYPEPITDGNQSFAEVCANVALTPNSYSF